MRFSIVALFCGMPLFAQPTVAPTPDAVGPANGENQGGYNIRDSFELGYRFRSVGGDIDSYRSMVNYGDGIRLLSSSMSVQSREGHGQYFDLLQINTQGLGNDPYQSTRLRVEKNKLYRYDLSWRSSAYFNPGTFYDPGLGLQGAHLIDTTRHYQDHDLTLLPQSKFKVFLGFSRNTQTGPALTSEQLFDARGDEYPLFANVNRKQNEFRAGFEGSLNGWRLNAMHGWVNYTEDTPVSLLAPSQGNNPTDLTSLTSLNRTEPYQGSSPYWRVVLFHETKLWSFNGRFTYVAGHRDFVQDETALGTDRLGNVLSRQIVTSGDASRPAATGNVNVSIFPWEKLTISNQTSIYNIRTDGTSVYTQLTNGVPISPSVPYTYLGIRTFANSTDADLRLTRWFAIRASYQFSDRRIRSVEGANFTTPPTPLEQENQLHSGILGVRIKPVKALTINLDGEIGRADHPIYPISDRNYQAFRGRVEFKKGAFRLVGYARSDYNINSAAEANYASRTRQYGADATWALSRGFFVDAGYAKLHLDTLGALNYFARVGNLSQDISTNTSYYVSNLHTATLSLRFALSTRWDLSAGFSQVKDVGDGRATPVSMTACSGIQCPAITPFIAVQTFPMQFTSPQARLSVRLAERVRWNLGYQHYGYSEDFTLQRNFRAHTGYSSVLWSF